MEVEITTKVDISDDDIEMLVTNHPKTVSVHHSAVPIVLEMNRKQTSALIVALTDGLLVLGEREDERD